MFKRFPIHRQLDQMDCGPSCLRMIAHYYGKKFSLQRMRELCHIDREGVSLEGIKVGAEDIGMNTLAVSIPYASDDPEVATLMEVPLPCVVHWRQRHFVVVYNINEQQVWIADPARGRVKLSRKDFEDAWLSQGDGGIVLLMEPTDQFFGLESEKEQRTGFSFLLKYFSPYRQLIVQLLLGYCWVVFSNFSFRFLRRPL